MIESEKPISLKKKNASYPKFHPALKAAVVAEGQEAVWVEDDGSKLRPRRRAKLTKKLNRFLFRQKSEPIPEENESKPVHVLKSKVKKSVVLIPQKGGEGTNALVEENTAQEAAVNMVKARQLLNQALVTEGTTEHIENSEKMAKAAFAHATTARRLMSTPEEQPTLDPVLSALVEKGEHEAYQHQKIVLSQSFDTVSTATKPPLESGPAAKAISYLESILPKNLTNDLLDAVLREIWSYDDIDNDEDDDDDVDDDDDDSDDNGDSDDDEDDVSTRESSIIEASNSQVDQTPENPKSPGKSSELEQIASLDDIIDKPKDEKPDEEEEKQEGNEPEDEKDPSVFINEEEGVGLEPKGEVQNSESHDVTSLKEENEEIEKKGEKDEIECENEQKESSLVPPVATTTPGDDSLINFVVSPGRANARTPNGGMVGNIVPSFTNEESVDESKEIDQAQNKSVESTRPKRKKGFSRIAGMLGGRGKKEAKATLEAQPNVQDLEKAVSYGTMKASEANMSAEGAPSSSDDEEAVIEQAISKGSMKAQESNLESEDAPVPPHLEHLQHLFQEETKPTDGEKEQFDSESDKDPLVARLNLERSKHRDPDGTNGLRVNLQISTMDKSKDPPKKTNDVEDARNLAPTPRRKALLDDIFGEECDTRESQSNVGFTPTGARSEPEYNIESADSDSFVSLSNDRYYVEEVSVLQSNNNVENKSKDIHEEGLIVKPTPTPKANGANNEPEFGDENDENENSENQKPNLFVSPLSTESPVMTSRFQNLRIGV